MFFTPSSGFNPNINNVNLVNLAVLDLRELAGLFKSAGDDVVRFVMHFVE
jgi:hypothetical protein